MREKSIQKELMYLTEQDITNYKWKNKTTFVGFVKLNKKLEKLLKPYTKIALSHESTDILYFEYWLEDGSFHYMFNFTKETVFVDKLINNPHLNTLIITLSHRK